MINNKRKISSVLKALITCNFIGIAMYFIGLGVIFPLAWISEATVFAVQNLVDKNTRFLKYKDDKR